MACHARRLLLPPSAMARAALPLRLRLPPPAILVLLRGRTAAAAAATGSSSPLVLARSHLFHHRGGCSDAGSSFSSSSSSVGPHPLPSPRALLHELQSRLTEEDEGEEGRQRRLRDGGLATPTTKGEGRMRRYRVVGDGGGGGRSDAGGGVPGAAIHPHRPRPPTGDVASDLIRSYLSTPAPDSKDSDVDAFLTDLVLGFTSSSPANGCGWVDEVDEAVRAHHATLSLEEEEEGEKEEAESEDRGGSLEMMRRRDERIRALRKACVTPHERLISTVLMADGGGGAAGLTWLIRLREDLLLCLGRRRQRLSSMEDDSEARRAEEVVTSRMRRMDEDLRLMLSERFGPGMLELRRITYERTPAAVIEAVARKEGVHPLRSLADLKTRLGPWRRCFALFHPSLPDEPLAFIHVALLPEIADSMDAIDRLTAAAPPSFGGDSDGRPPLPRVAVFYSINNTRAGLGGVELGNLLIKRAVNVLREEFPSSLDTFATLSPIPRFRAWLVERATQLIALASAEVEESESAGVRAEIDAPLLSRDDVKVLSRALAREGDDGNDVVVVLERLLDVLDEPSWCDDGAVASALRPVLMRLAARYLVLERDGRGRSLDGVARFHVRNGAEMYRLNYLADRSRRGMLNSAGMMINYRYNLGTLEENRCLYEVDGIIPIREGVAEWLPACSGND